ncbi:reverse transcriptase zinc-binding domain-containing protein [Artemisia annua]|uniref:Reverse transcriptase zinc-binding domain-containing protein n=1 Tax=Artemisia annua TaxID=35608 RepID=A0A2U1Q776_ARTAN|nr:reverse transcriptase zinc-binding domain-containing protein [Artemisia annua]
MARQWESYLALSSGGGVWTEMVKLGKMVKVDGATFISLIHSKIGNGKTTRFWMDPWHCETPLRRKFPALYRLEGDKSCKVADRVLKNGGVRVFGWNWKNTPSTTLETLELTDLITQLRDTYLTDAADSWIWSGSSVGFSAAAVKAWMPKPIDNNSLFALKWCRWLPSKCNIFMWRAINERIPTKMALAKRNIYTDNTTCPLCEEGEETAAYLFTGCGYSCGLWQMIARWCGIPPIFAFDARDLVDIFNSCGCPPAYKEAIQGIIIITCWRLWKARNELVFKGKEVKISEIISDVKSIGFLWYKHRKKENNCTWVSWCKFNLM